MLGLVLASSAGVSLLVNENDSEGWWVASIGLGFLSVFGVSCKVVGIGCGLEGGWKMFDHLSWMMVELCLIICGLCMIGASKVVQYHNFSGFYSCLIVMAALFLMLAFSSESLLWFYWWFECSLVPVVCMILGWGSQAERAQAVKYMVLYTLLGSLPFLGGVIYSYKNLCSWVMWGLHGFIGGVWWLVLLAPFLVKVPLYGVHSWLPKAHVEAPVEGSMILAGLTLKLGGYGMIRVLKCFMGSLALVEWVVIVMAIWGSFVCCLVCLRQMDMKSLVAYSSVCHMGLVVGGVLTSSGWGVGGSVMMMVGHAFSSSGLFFLVGVIYSVVGSRSLKVCKGVLVLSPSVYMLGFLLLGAGMSMPPSLNLCGEVLLVGSIVQLSVVWWVLIAVISVLTVGYSLYFFSVLFHGSPSEMFGSLESVNYSSMLVMGLHVSIVL
uniref:NADH dehydrogenase subunit 4 n=1 Tax=Barbatia decussata TaxID=1508519 RepID=UPI002028B41A|nr:NADH dehydrogenase subunit 4 [Barbatia decussata]UQT66002.1 NADH dehydrogenase subunit 4 [Barbatia decussata]